MLILHRVIKCNSKKMVGYVKRIQELTFKNVRLCKEELRSDI